MSCVLHRYARKASLNLDAGCDGRIRRPGVLVHASLPYLVSSPDGVFEVQSGGVLVRAILLEVKASKYRITPGVYKHQMQPRLLVSQADYGIVLCYIVLTSSLHHPYITLTSSLHHPYIILKSYAYIILISYLYHTYIILISYLFHPYIILISSLYHPSYLILRNGGNKLNQKSVNKNTPTRF